MRVVVSRGPRQCVHAHQEQHWLGPRDGVCADHTQELQLQSEGAGGAARRGSTSPSCTCECQPTLSDVLLYCVFVLISIYFSSRYCLHLHLKLHILMHTW
jgi:hypothetical protein